MAKPIDATPVLEGEDAKRLLMEMEQNKTHNVVREAHLNRCREIFKSIQLR